MQDAIAELLASCFLHLGDFMMSQPYTDAGRSELLFLVWPG